MGWISEGLDKFENFCGFGMVFLLGRDLERLLVVSKYFIWIWKGLVIWKEVGRVSGGLEIFSLDWEGAGDLEGIWKDLEAVLCISKDLW